MGLKVLSVLTMGSLHTKLPPYVFLKIVWGLLAGAKAPQIQVLDNLPAMAVRNRNRLRNGPAVDSRV